MTIVVKQLLDDDGEHGHLLSLTSLVLIFNIDEGLMEKRYISGSLRVSLWDNLNK